MALKKRPTLEELTARIHDGLDASDEDLAVLFRDDEAPILNQSEQNVTGTTQQQEPQNQQTQPAPNDAEETTPAPAAAEGEPDEILGIIPEKFRDKDSKIAVQKVVKSYGELEEAATRQSQELAQLRKFVNEMVNKPVKTPETTTKTPEVEEEDELSFLEKPRSSARKVSQEEAIKVVASALQHYDAFAQRRKLVDDFKREHADFDTYRNEVLEVLKDKPYLDQDMTALPMIYAEAKQRASAKASRTREFVASNVDVEKIKKEAVEQAKKEILEEVRKRKAAAGVIQEGTSTTIDEKVKATSKKENLTPEDEIFSDMLNSGPKALRRES